MKNIFVLPTDKPSRLLQCLKVIELLDKEWLSPIGKVNRNIYITNSEKPKEGDWVYENNLNQETKIYQIIKRDGRLMFFRFRSVPIWLDENQHGCKKIILTTDVDLIKDGVQAIDDAFLEWFVKNPSCESVKVERLDTFKKTNEVYVDEIAGGNYYEIIKQYKIIIPKEEPKKFGDSFEDLTNVMSIANSMFGKKEESKQETLEKVAKKQWGNVHRTESIDFIAGANLQAERMLTDGDLVKLLDFVSKEYNISNGVGWFHSHESIEDVSSKEVLDKWFEKYKINKL
jgi:hypothetical protein